MDWKVAMQEERAALQRIVALLFSLADLAELACGRSPAVLGFVLWLLRRAEAVARDFVGDVPDTPPASMPAGSLRADAMRLAASFRALARQLRAVLRKSVPVGAGRGVRPPLVLHAGQDGLRVCAHHADVAVAYHQPDPRPVDSIALPGAALDDFEGDKGGLVTLENVASDSVRARWDDRGVPQVRDYPALDREKHYWIGDEEVEKLIRYGEGWLAAHPEREAITRGYLKRRWSLVKKSRSSPDRLLRKTCS